MKLKLFLSKNSEVSQLKFFFWQSLTFASFSVIPVININFFCSFSQHQLYVKTGQGETPQYYFRIMGKFFLLRQKYFSSFNTICHSLKKKQPLLSCHLIDKIKPLNATFPSLPPMRYNMSLRSGAGSNGWFCNYLKQFL